MGDKQLHGPKTGNGFMLIPGLGWAQCEHFETADAE
jgi:hypothetical protein